jgi:hypothetical protein
MKMAISAKGYLKDFDDQVIELGKGGATIAIMADALSVSIEQLEDWARAMKSFKDALSVAMTSSRAFHERRLIESYTNKDSNSTLIQSLLKANFGDVYTNSTYQPTGMAGKGKKADLAEPIDFNAEIASLIHELRVDSAPSGSKRGKKAEQE